MNIKILPSLFLRIAATLMISLGFVNLTAGMDPLMNEAEVPAEDGATPHTYGLPCGNNRGR